VVLEQLDGGLGEEDVDAALDGVEGDGVVGGVRGEDGDGVAGLEAVDGGLVGVRVDLVVGGEGVERGVEPVVGLRDVAVEVLADGGELCAVDAHHAELADLAAAAQVEEREADDAHLFVRGRGAAADEAGGVLAGADLRMSVTRQYNCTDQMPKRGTASEAKTGGGGSSE